MVFLQNVFDARAVGRFRENELFVENVIARFYFNLTHVVTRSVSLILLKSGFSACPLRYSIGFRDNASYIS